MNKKITLEGKILNRFTMKNTSSQKDIGAIEVKIESANNLKDLFDVFKFIKLLNLKFKNEKLGKNYMTIVGLIFVGLWLLAFLMSRKTFGVLKYFFWIVMSYVIFASICGWWFFKTTLCTKKISDLISLKKVVLDNGLIFDRSDKKKLFKCFKNRFVIFQLGNYSRELIQYIKGEYRKKLIYHYFHFHYIDEEEESSTDANGNTESDTEYKHYDLYGIIIPFSTKNFIKISNYELALKFKKFIKWKTSSISFNKEFKVYTENEQAVAIFLQPKVMEQIEKLYEIFPKLDIELSPQGFLALSTPDQELLNYTRQYGLDQIDLFENEIKKVLDQTKLHKALEFINFLKEYHEHI